MSINLKELDPMLIIQCNCSNVVNSQSYQIGCLYSEDEIQESGETDVYEFEGGSGFINTVQIVMFGASRLKFQGMSF